MKNRGSEETRLDGTRRVTWNISVEVLSMQ